MPERIGRREAVSSWLVTHVRFWAEGRDLMVEYRSLKSQRPSQANAVRDAITVVSMDPERAERRYSIRLDRETGYMAMPFRTPDGLTCLVWRHSPDGDDAIEIVDWDQPWGDELDRPPVWPPPDQ
jgi:hypothetical protein